MRGFRTLSMMAVLVATACSSSTEGPPGPSGAAGQPGPAGQAGTAAPAPAAGKTDGPAAIEVAPSLSLPGNGFYPQSVSSATDGTLFVGGIAGEVVKISPDSLEPVVIATSLGVIPGLTVDNKTNSVFICGNAFNPPAAAPGEHQNPFQNPSATVYQYDFDGKLLNKYPFPAADAGKSICEDLTFDTHHNLFMTDAFTGAIFELADGAAAVAKWTSDPLLAANSTSTPQHVPGFGAHGITFDGTGNLYVTNFYNSSLTRIPVGADGKPGQAVAQTISAAPDSPGSLYAQPEGVLALDATHLVGTAEKWGAEAGSLFELTQTAPDTWTWSVLRNDLHGPTSVTRARGNYFIVEGQAAPLVNYLIGWSDAPPNPTLPFRVQREVAASTPNAMGR